MSLLKWGVVSTAKIAREKLIPAIRASATSEVHAIASRNIGSAERVAKDMGIPNALGSYEELLARDDIDVIYNPLPNHLHVPVTIQALKAGKHVLCEKPLGMRASDMQPLLDVAAQKPELKLMEAFMYRFHPQWQKAKSVVESGVLGDVTFIDSAFTYFNDDPANVRNQQGIGGGALLDVGCYCISLSRYLFDSEPLSVSGSLRMNEESGVDIQASGIMQFANGDANFVCSMQLQNSQWVRVLGSKGSMLIDAPFYPRSSGSEGAVPQKVIVCVEENVEVYEYNNVNQYVLQVDAFADAVINNKPVPTPLGDALNNIRVIDGLFESHHSGSQFIL